MITHDASARPDIRSEHRGTRACLLAHPLRLSESSDDLRKKQKAHLRRQFRDVGWQAPRVLDALGGAADMYVESIGQVRAPAGPWAVSPSPANSLHMWTTGTHSPSTKGSCGPTSIRPRSSLLAYRASRIPGPASASRHLDWPFGWHRAGRPKSLAIDSSRRPPTRSNCPTTSTCTFPANNRLFRFEGVAPGASRPV